MGGLIAAITAGLTNAILAIIGKLFTQAMFEKVIAKVSVALLRKAAAMTTNTVDDELIEDVAKRLGES